MQPNKPQLALAWLGEKNLLHQAWNAMKNTHFLGEPPLELMPSPSSFSLETETWRYRFYQCTKIADFMHMRFSAQRPAGVLWCCSVQNLSLFYNEPFFLAGALRLPMVVLVVGAKEGSREAEENERNTREYLEECGFSADEAFFVYGVQDVSKATNTEWVASIEKLFRALDTSLVIPAEQKLPSYSVCCSQAEMLFFQGTGTLWKPPAAQEVSVPASYWKPNCTLELRAFDRAGGIKARILAETRKSPIEAALTLQIDFQQPISFTRDAGFYVATEATSHKQQRDSWGGLHYEHYTARAFFIREIS